MNLKLKFNSHLNLVATILDREAMGYIVSPDSRKIRIIFNKLLCHDSDPHNAQHICYVQIQLS